MKKNLLFLFFILRATCSFSQIEGGIRIILIGDAGKITTDQAAALAHASNAYAKGHQTIVLFLGDNIYQHGMGLPGTPEEASTKQILESQFRPMLVDQTKVYFIPGNHDWTKSDIIGLKKIQAAGRFLEEQRNPNLKMIPSIYGCPDPEAIAVSDSVIVIAYDSQWWLLRERTDSLYNDCKCKTEEAVVTRLKELRDQNKGKILILASHHPFQSYGNHGGKFFPLLYVPPILVYPLFRHKRLVQDLKNPKYQHLINEISNVFKDTPGVIYAAGHEHGLQLMNNGKQTQIVSGSGANRNYLKHTGAPQIFAEKSQGFVVLDLNKSSTIINMTYVFWKRTEKRWVEKKWLLNSTGQLKTN